MAGSLTCCETTNTSPRHSRLRKAAPGTLQVGLAWRTCTRMQLLRRHTLPDECRILLVHGLLHLLGYDHEAGAEGAAAMERAERRILRRLGWRVRCAPDIPDVCQMVRHMAECLCISIPQHPQSPGCYVAFLHDLRTAGNSAVGLP